jgi:medium-chain acyl-[acyl-carrier-protein] hydrolase
MPAQPWTSQRESWPAPTQRDSRFGSNVTSPNPWIQHRPPNSAPRLRLFCFHHAGGAANAFRDWNRRLPSFVDICPVQLPGHSTRMREPLIRNLEQLTKAATDGLLPELIQPFAFFGHSLGALLAFQVTRELQSRGAAGPAHLFVAARTAPRNALRRPPLYDLPDADFVREMQIRYNAIPQEIANAPDVLALVLPTLRADFGLHEGYIHRAGDRLSCDISAYGGAADQNVTEDDLEGWRDETTGRFSKEILAGGHFFVHASDSQFTNVLSRELSALVRRADDERLLGGSGL